jgi:hypothetical protein
MSESTALKMIIGADKDDNIVINLFMRDDKDLSDPNPDWIHRGEIISKNEGEFLILAALSTSAYCQAKIKSEKMIPQNKEIGRAHV